MQKRGKSAQRRKGFKAKVQDKQIKQREPEVKDKVVPEEKRVFTEEQKKMYIQRFGYDPTVE